MSATYTPGPPFSSALDHVRFLIRDTNTTAALFSDEEIQSVIAAVSPGSKDAAIPYLAAVELLEAIHLTWMTRGRGHASKKIGRLSVAYGTGAGINIDAAIQTAIRGLKAKAAALNATEPYIFSLL